MKRRIALALASQGTRLRHEDMTLVSEARVHMIDVAMKRAFALMTVGTLIFTADALAQTNAHGEPVPVVATSLSELLPLLKIGTTVLVTDSSGVKRTGTITTLTPPSFATPTTQRRALADEPLRAWWANDGLSNGVRYGAYGGAAADLLFTVSFGPGLDAPLPEVALAYAVLIVPAGIAVGASIDGLIRHKELHVDYRPTPVKKTTIYVAPLADARRRGVSLSIRY